MLPAFKVHLNDGTSYVTSMAAGVTLEVATRYFKDQWLEQPDETLRQVVEVEEVTETPEYGPASESEPSEPSEE